MVLTLRTNGSGGSNIITAGWFNDFYNLLTGLMSDQPVQITNGLVLKQVTFTTPTAPTLALSAGTGPGIGAYTYAVGFGMGNGKTLAGTTAAITTTTGNQQVSLSVIPTGPTGTQYRTLYRSKVGTTTPLYALAVVNDNTTTTFLDTVADTSLVLFAPTHDSFGGYLQVLNSSSSLKAEIYSDGSIFFDAGNIMSDGSGNVTAKSLATGAHASSLDNGAITTDGAGGIKLTATKSIAWFSGATNEGGISVDAAGNVTILNGSGGALATIDNTGNLSLGNALHLNGNGWIGPTGNFMNASQHSSGTGSGTFNHNLGVTPKAISITTGVVGSQTVGYDSVTSTQFHVTTGSGLGWAAISFNWAF